MKKVLVLILAIMMLASVAVGCGQKAPAQDAPTQDAPTQDAPAQDKSADKPAEKVTISFGIPSDSSNYDLWTKVVDAFMAENENITVELEDYGDVGDYISKLKVLAATDSLPDVYFNWLGTAMEPIIQAGGALDLKPYLEADKEWYDTYVPNAIDAATEEDGNIYILPHDRAILCYWVNTSCFTDNGLEVPKTFDEFIAACPTLNEAGIVPWLIGAQDDWSLSWSGDDFMVRYDTMDTEYYYEIAAGNKKFADNPDYLKGVSHIVDLIEAGAFNENAATTTRDGARAAFCNKECAIFSGGSFDAGPFGENHIDPDQVQPIAWFAFNDSETPQTMISDNFEGGCAARYDLEGEKLEAALAFLKFTASETCQNILLEAGSLPPYNREYNEKYVNDLLNKALKLANENTRYLHSYYMFNSAFQPGYYRALSELYTGAITPEEFLVSLDEAYAEAYGS